MLCQSVHMAGIIKSSCPCTLCNWENNALRVGLWAQAAQESPRARVAWSIGAVGRCLSRNLAENQPLGPECRALVIAAAPKACPLPHLPFPLRCLACRPVLHEIPC